LFLRQWIIPRWLVLIFDLYITINTFVVAYAISNKLPQRTQRNLGERGDWS